ncbi:MAG: hypothetical protein GY835_04350 [bacterium]|nr:hypothetical protein [bacterium]
MGIDYVISYPCENRKELGESGLRRWTFLFMICKYLRDHPELSDKYLDEKEWNMPSFQGLKPEERTFRYKDLQEISKKIPMRIERCKNCPANMDPKAEEFGCVGRINYPILSCFEEFISDRLQTVIDRRPQEEWPTLLNLILRRDSPFDGQAVHRLRETVLKNDTRLLERTQTISFRRAGDGITTDQILHALLGMASPNSETTGYSREIPRELMSIYLDFLSGVLYNSLAENRVTEMSRHCSTYLQYRWLHRALRIAHKLGVPIYLH